MNREDCCPFPLLHEINSPKFNQPNQHHSGDEKMRIDKPISAIAFAMLVSLTILLPTSATAQATRAASPKFSNAVAFDVSPALRNLPPRSKGLPSNFVQEIRPERGPVAVDRGFSGDTAVQLSQPTVSAIPTTLANFEGLSNQDNFNTFGFRVNPPDTVGAVGPNHYALGRLHLDEYRPRR